MKLKVDNFLSLSCYTRTIAFVRQVNALMKQCPRKQKMNGNKDKKTLKSFALIFL